MFARGIFVRFTRKFKPVYTNGTVTGALRSELFKNERMQSVTCRWSERKLLAKLKAEHVMIEKLIKIANEDYRKIV